MSKKRGCMSCKYYRSLYEEYDCDEFEPIYQGRCLNEKQKDDDKSAGEGILCDLWERS